jgi:hypothetical protein
MTTQRERQKNDDNTHYNLNDKQMRKKSMAIQMKSDGPDDKPDGNHMTTHMAIQMTNR